MFVFANQVVTHGVQIDFELCHTKKLYENQLQIGLHKL